jgi:zinc transport system ATP-binding protein
MTNDAIQVKELSVKINETVILDNLSFTIPKAQVTSIIGPNGAGKTTLLSAILGMIEYSGSVEFCDGNNVKIGYVPQRLSLAKDSAVTAADLFTMTHQKKPVYLGTTRRCGVIAEEYLNLVQMAHYKNRKLSVLSGGELQRVLIGLALSRKPSILIMDEASAGIDFQGSSALDDLTRKLNRENSLTVIMVSHDLSVVNRSSDHIVCINKTLVCQGPPEKTLTPKSIANAFGNPALHSHAH